ncbi:universal stress protein [Amycolatopsis orientalis]|uniref:universal stress protein n=1 Tax=Amycolatopsis orientalis TaxID=31958 RepID=UPI000429302F|nr:universal stress protein [Amycolatopsis orientalis]
MANHEISKTLPVLAGVDGSPQGVEAARWAAEEAAARKVPLELFHAFTPMPGHDPAQGFGARCLREAESAVRDAVPGLPFRCALEPGDPAEQLIERSGSAAVVAVGAWGFGRTGASFLGAVARAVAARAASPVVVVRERVPASGPVIVGVDDSPDGRAALDFAFSAAAARECPLVPVRVWYDHEQEKADALMLTGCLADRTPVWPDVVVRPRLVRDRHRARGMLAEAGGARLIVVGSHRARLRSKPILGITSHALLDLASCPVAVVPPPVR